MVKSWKTWTAAALAVAALGFWGWRRHKAAAAAAADAPPAAAVTRGDLEVRFVDSGEIQPKNYVDVASQVSGRVVEMDVQEGEKVDKGRKLCVIQPGRSETEGYVPTSVHSPISGVVMRYQKDDGRQEGKIARVGDYVTGIVESNSPTYLMRVADLRRLIVRMKISEMDILKLHVGMDVKVTLDALPGKTFPGRVAVVSPEAEKDQNGIRSFAVDVDLLGLDPEMKPGMTARVDGLLDSRKNVLKIPLSAVFEEGGKDVAYVAVPDGKPRRVVLKLGLRNETDAELLDGPKLGTALLTDKPASGPGGADSSD
ncbi:MAG: efflux RND transporter periplasmic adaptor subunit [Elusimicrobia bacterium]|nr:efflux RND transporter periplasmic adaptor subunit [Elusimicrobiota bacterium]